MVLSLLTNQLRIPLIISLFLLVGSGSQPQVSIHTPTPAVEELGIIQLACSVAMGNRSDDEDDVLWTKAGGGVVTGGMSYLGGRVLNLEGVGSKDAGSYCCVVREYLSCTARLVVYDPGKQGCLSQQGRTCTCAIDKQNLGI